MKFRSVYLAIAAAIFLIEVAIALGYIPGTFVRSSVGDILVIALLYYLLRGVIPLSPTIALVIALMAGFTAEVLQYLRLADLLGLSEDSPLSIILGTTYSTLDLVMYSIGGVLAIWLDVRVLHQHLYNHTNHDS